MSVKKYCSTDIEIVSTLDYNILHAIFGAQHFIGFERVGGSPSQAVGPQPARVGRCHPHLRDRETKPGRTHGKHPLFLSGGSGVG